MPSNGLKARREGYREKPHHKHFRERLDNTDPATANRRVRRAIALRKRAQAKHDVNKVKATTASAQANIEASSKLSSSMSNITLLALQLVLVRWFCQLFDAESTRNVEIEPIVDASEVLTHHLMSYTISTILLLNGVILLTDARSHRGNDWSLQYLSAGPGRTWETPFATAAVSAAFLIPAVALLLAYLGIAEILYTAFESTIQEYRKHYLAILSSKRGPQGEKHITSATTVAFVRQSNKDLNLVILALLLGLPVLTMPTYGNRTIADFAMEIFPESASKLVGWLILPWSTDALLRLLTLVDKVAMGEISIDEVLTHLTKAARRCVIILTLSAMIAAKWYGKLFVPVASIEIGGFLALMVLMAGLVVDTKLSNAGAILVAQFALCQIVLWW